LAQQIAAAYLAHTAPRAILLTGSAAEGLSDDFSDLDLIIYYDELPAADALSAARTALAARDNRVLTSDENASSLEEFLLHGVTCQVAHLTITIWERDLATVLDQFEPATTIEKAISGLLHGRALHGDDLIAQWQSRAADYPDALAHASVTHHLHFFPLWLIGERWQTRDATIFFYQTLVETSLNLLAVLAGLNRRYFSSFQFKRLHRFAADLPLAPADLANRLDVLYTLDPVAAGLAMERLVEEMLTLVEAHMPDIDTTPAHRHLGRRPQPWRPTSPSP
jgi:hypothetical protein